MSIRRPASNLESQGVSHCVEPHSTEGHISVQFKNVYLFRLNNIHGLKLTKFHKLLAEEIDYDSPCNHG